MGTFAAIVCSTASTATPPRFAAAPRSTVHSGHTGWEAIRTIRNAGAIPLQGRPPTDDLHLLFAIGNGNMPSRELRRSQSTATSVRRCRGGIRSDLRAPQNSPRSSPKANALGFQLGPRSGVTVLDVDTRNEGVIEDAFDRHGPSPFIVRTGGGYHAYYRHGGEKRHIRPYADQPIDILGGGLVVAPPSVSAKGRYEIIRGSLDDLASLPPIHVVLDFLRRVTAPIPEGRRDSTLFRQLLREARHCDDFESLLDVARSVNMDCIPPMTDAQTIKIAKSAWGFEISGNNWVGRKARASTDREEILALSYDPAAAMLLMLWRIAPATERRPLRHRPSQNL